MRHITARVPSMLASDHSTFQSMASTCVRSIQAAAKIINACARHVKMKAAKITGGRRFEVSFTVGIDQTWLLSRRRLRRSWNRLSLNDGGGSFVEYQNGIYEKFSAAVDDTNQNDLDPTLLFIATDGRFIFKAFSAPATAVENDYYCSTGFDDDTYMGVWSHDWMRRQIDDMEQKEDPDEGWGKLMEQMVLTIAEYADGITPPEVGNS